MKTTLISRGAENNMPPPLPDNSDTPPPPPPDEPNETGVAANPAQPNIVRYEPIPLSASEPPDYIKWLIADEIQKFELHLLTCTIWNPSFLQQVKGVICKSPTPEKKPPLKYTFINDFQSPAASAVYAAVRRIREMPGLETHAISGPLVESILKTCNFMPDAPELLLDC